MKASKDIQTMVRIREATRITADEIAQVKGWTLVETFERGINGLQKRINKPRRPKPAA